MPRRRAGVLLPLEEAILEIGLSRDIAGDPDFYGFAVSEELATGDDAARLVSHGALYKALGRLERDGLLESHWEDIDPAAEGRPRRRLYRVTGRAAAALAKSRLETAAAPARARRWVTT